jgi:hypothetical protein
MSVSSDLKDSLTGILSVLPRRRRLWFKVKWFLKAPLRWLENLERWIAYRTYDKYHVVKTDLTPAYYDKDTILLHANFALLVDFVETELASRGRAHDTWREWLWLNLPSPFSSLFATRGRGPGEAELRSSIEYNEEHDKQYETDHAEPLKEILALYLWWKDIRPARPKASVASGLTGFWNTLYGKYGYDLWEFVPCERAGIECYEMKNKYSDEEDEELRRLSQKDYEIEQRYWDEDTEMLTRLMKTRGALWT